MKNLIKVVTNSSLVKKITFEVSKNAPAILMGAGIASMSVGVIDTIKKTLHVTEVIQNDVDKIVEIKETGEALEQPATIVNSHELRVQYAKMGLNLTRHYASSAMWLGTSVGCFMFATHIVTGRYKEAMAAYTAVNTAFLSYRERVKERFGDEVERELYYNLKKETVVELDENGNAVEKEVTSIQGDNVGGVYTYVFDRSNPRWDIDPNINLMLLNSEENLANHILRTHKYVFLNDILTTLGFPKTKIGHHVGWIYKEMEDGSMAQIDFGQYHTRLESGENAVILEFNVQGDIYHQLED